MKTIQFGQALTADFEQNTFTFEMKKDFTVLAGEYAIIPRELYDEIRNDLEKLKEELLKIKNNYGTKRG